MIESATPAFNATRDASRKFVSSARANPRPFLMGGALVAGGLLVVAYYMRKHESSTFFAEGFDQPETWRTENSSEFVRDDVANAS